MNSYEFLRKEYDRINNDSTLINLGCSISLPENGNYYIWRIILKGPKDTSFSGGIFSIEIKFPYDFPNSSPLIHFLTPIYHPNVKFGKNGLGHVNFNTLFRWKSSTRIREVLTKLYAIFYWINPESCYSLEVANEYKENRRLYEKKVNYFTKKYASMDEPLKYCDKDWDFLIMKMILIPKKYWNQFMKKNHRIIKMTKIN